jgi:ribosomal protein S18 acetylase RimI-like enzyme
MQNFSLQVRSAAKSDSEALLSLLEEARKFKISLGDDAWGDYPFTQDDVDLRLKSNACYVVESDGMLVGSITLIWEDEHNWGDKGLDGQAGYVHGLMVCGAYRGKGLGEYMIDWAIQEVRARDRQFIRLDCPANNQGLRSYYEKLGFELVDTKHNTAYCHYQRNV